jgi:hypothetical protein
MRDTVTAFLSAITADAWRRAVRAVVFPVADKYSSCALNSAGLVIKAGGSTLAKTGASDFYAVANGILVKIAAATDMPALTGLTITQAKFNVICFLVDAAGTVTAAMGSEGTAIANVKFPQLPEKKALIGFLLITNAGGTFTGGTTALDTATTVYVNANGPFDPTILLGN